MKMELMTVSDAARIIGVSAATVRMYEREGKLSARRTPGGIRLFERTEVQQLAAERNRKTELEKQHK